MGISNGNFCWVPNPILLTKNSKGFQKSTSLKFELFENFGLLNFLFSWKIFSHDRFLWWSTAFKAPQIPLTKVVDTDLDNWKRISKEPKPIRPPHKRISAPVDRFRASRRQKEEAAARVRTKEVRLPEYQPGSASRISLTREEGEQKPSSWFERNLVRIFLFQDSFSLRSMSNGIKNKMFLFISQMDMGRSVSAPPDAQPPWTTYPMSPTHSDCDHDESPVELPNDLVRTYHHSKWANQSINQSVNAWINQSSGECINQSIKRWMHDSIIQSISKLWFSLVNWSVFCFLARQVRQRRTGTTAAE